MIAFYIDHFSPFIIQFGNGYGLRWYGTAYVMGFLLGYWMLCWFSKKGYSELPVEKVGDFVAAVALWGVLLGGRLGYALFYDFQNILADPLQFFRVWEGGMASHGGILGIVIFTFWYARRHKLSWMGLGDNLVVAAPLGIFFGRCANFINGELYGRATHVPWAMQFPKEIYGDPGLADRAVAACSKLDPLLNSRDAIVAAAQTSEPVRAALAAILTPRHPSQLYEAAMEGLLLFLLLWFLRTKTRVAEGVTTGAFFILYALVRIFGEQFREPDDGVAFTLGLTRGQFLSVFMILFGAALVGYHARRNRPAVRPSGAPIPAGDKRS